MCRQPMPVKLPGVNFVPMVVYDWLVKILMFSVTLQERVTVHVDHPALNPPITRSHQGGAFKSL